MEIRVLPTPSCIACTQIYQRLHWLWSAGVSSANSCSKHPPNLPVTSPTSASASVKSSQNPLAGPASFAPQPCQYFLEVDQLQTRLFQSHRLYYSYYTDSQPTQKNTYSCHAIQGCNISAEGPFRCQCCKLLWLQAPLSLHVPQEDLRRGPNSRTIWP